MKADQSSNLCGVQLHDVFLFNYDPESTEEQVKEHFTNKGVRVHSVKQKSHPDADAKSFLMRIKNKEDFDVIINNVPLFHTLLLLDGGNVTVGMEAHQIIRKFLVVKVPQGGKFENSNLALGKITVI